MLFIFNSSSLSCLCLLHDVTYTYGNNAIKLRFIFFTEIHHCFMVSEQPRLNLKPNSTATLKPYSTPTPTEKKEKKQQPLISIEKALAVTSSSVRSSKSSNNKHNRKYTQQTDLDHDFRMCCGPV